MNIAFAGTNISILRYLHQRYGKIRVFREAASRGEAVAEYCDAHGLLCITVEGSHDMDSLAGKMMAGGEVLWVCSFGIILQPQCIAKFSRVFNLHSGDLTWNRGPQPLFHDIIRGSECAFLSCHTIEDKCIDAGRLACTSMVPIDYRGTFANLLNSVYSFAPSMIDHVLSQIADDKLSLAPISAQSGSYLPRVSARQRDIILEAKSLHEARQVLQTEKQ